jgi:lambda family phage portal protein
VTRTVKATKAPKVTKAAKATGPRASPRDVQSAARLAGGRLRARYDAAETNDENRRHWAMADGLSADAAAAPGVRRILRNRTRYEVANNTYARGMVSTLANDCVGTGPRLQMTGLGRDLAREVERKFATWAKAAGLAEKLRTLRMAKATDGEGFGLLITNPRLSNPVKLDLRLVEAEQVASPMAAVIDPYQIDGIHFDEYGNPTKYEVLREHPGGRSHLTLSPLVIPADKVVHYFTPERPGQRRGIPELTAALPLFAQLRRWTLAVLAAAETAADMAAIMHTNGAASAEEAAKAEEFERIEFERRAILTLPEGWDVTQMDAKHPTSTYAEVKREILNEIARTINMPYNVAACNSSGYNYSSGRLDWQIYGRSIGVDRERMEAQVLEDIFAAWFREGVLVEGYFSQPLRLTTTDTAHAWRWDGFSHIDPESEAKADDIRLANGSTDLSEIYAAKGYDWEERLEMRAKITQRTKELATQYGGDGASGDVQTQAMNGIQIQAMTGVLAEVTAKRLSADAAIGVLTIAFPGVDRAQIEAMVNAAAATPAPPAEVAP